jgi:hypothetical protein
MKISFSLEKAKRLLFILEFLEALEASFIIGLILYLSTVIKLSYMLNIIYFMLILCLIFLITALRGMYKDYVTNLA